MLDSLGLATRPQRAPRRLVFLGDTLWPLRDLPSSRYLTRHRLNGYSIPSENDEVGSPLGQVCRRAQSRTSMKNRDIDGFPGDDPFQRGQRRG